MRHAKQYQRGSKGKAFLFFLTLAAFGILSLLMPLRPTESTMEKRKLAEFPEFSVETLADGEYTQDIDLWFSDTFPLRDQFRKLSNWVETFYGVKTVEIIGDLEQGDEIPDAPYLGE